MTSVDQGAVLKEHAALNGPDALSLVERVGRERADILFADMAERFGDGTPAAFYGLRLEDSWSLYDLLQSELRRVDEDDMRRRRRQHDPTRLKFSSERTNKAD